MLDQVRLNNALSNLERVGAPVGSLRGTASFTEGLDLVQLGQLLGTQQGMQSASRAAPLALPLVAGTGGSGVGGMLTGLLGGAGAVGSIISGGIMLGEYLTGLGDEQPQEAVDRAGRDQRDHEQLVADGCVAADHATDAMSGVTTSCVDSVEKICDSTVAFADIVKAALGLGAKYAAIMGPVMGMAVATIQGLLSSRNDALGSCMEALIVDHVPAAQPGNSADAVCKDPEPADPAEVGAPGKVPEPCPPVHQVDCPPAAAPKQPVAAPPAEPCDVVTQPAQAAPVAPSAPAAEPAPKPNSPVTPAAAPVTTTAPAPVGSECPPVQAPVVPSGGSSAVPCPPLINPQHVQGMLDQGMRTAAGAWHHFVSTIDGMLCPQEPVMPEVNQPAPQPEMKPVADPCPEPIGQDCPEEQVSEVQDCPEEQVLEVQDCPEEQEPEVEPTEEPQPEGKPVPEPEPVAEAEPEPEPAEQGFDKSQHPTVPDGAVESPVPEGKGTAPATAEPPVPPEPAPAPTPAPESAPAPAPPAPEAADPAPHWTPDIWVSSAAAVDVSVTAAAAESTEEVVLERIGSW